MKKYLTKERVFFIIGLLVVVLGLTGCTTDQSTLQNGFGPYADEDFFGWILVWPIAWVMNFIGSAITTNAGGSFIFGLFFTTIIVRTLAWPIYAKTNDMSLKMTVAQPEMNRIQQKYANRKDPQSQQRMQQEMMAVYKKYKINFLGCFAPFIQMPIFMAMYNVVNRITVATHTKGEVVTDSLLYLGDTSLFGIENCLSVGVFGENAAELWSPAFFVGIALSLVVGGTMWLLNHLSQKKPSYAKNTQSHNANNQQANQMASSMKFMSYFMIVMMVIASLNNNGLALYWVFGNLYSIAQNFINRYLNEKKYYKMKKENTVDNLI